MYWLATGLLAVAGAGLGSARLLPDEIRLQLLPPSAALSSTCSCGQWCQPVAHVPAREIFGFGAPKIYKGYPWDLVTSIAWAGGEDLVCEAHKNNVRIIAAAPKGMPLSGDKAVRQKWIDATVQAIVASNLDGLTFDYESPLSRADPRNRYYVDIVRETNEALKNIHQGYQVSVCAAWGPGFPSGIDGRAYDYVQLAAVSDFLYVMQYDTRSQIFDACVASANCALPLSKKGIEEYIDAGVPPSKMVMGVPWYGYKYECVGVTDTGTTVCPIKQVPFRGVNCSDAAGGEIQYKLLQEIAAGPNRTTAIMTDTYMQAKYFNFLENGRLHQIWFDDAETLVHKYRLAKQMGLRGVGPYMFSYVDEADESFTAMFNALREFV